MRASRIINHRGFDNSPNDFETSASGEPKIISPEAVRAKFQRILQYAAISQAQNTAGKRLATVGGANFSLCGERESPRHPDSLEHRRNLEAKDFHNPPNCLEIEKAGGLIGMFTTCKKDTLPGK